MSKSLIERERMTKTRRCTISLAQQAKDCLLAPRIFEVELRVCMIYILRFWHCSERISRLVSPSSTRRYQDAPDVYADTDVTSHEEAPLVHPRVISRVWT